MNMQKKEVSQKKNKIEKVIASSGNSMLVCGGAIPQKYSSLFEYNSVL